MTECVKRGACGKEAIEKDMARAGIKAPLATKVYECISARQDDLRQCALATIGKTSKAYLEDFDWRLHVTIASDKCSALNQPTAMVDLCLRHATATSHIADPSSVEHVQLELSRDQLAALVEQLDRAQAAVAELRV
eukprot:TRINITY_DN2858_c0_g1_i2.p1 TRINITY_DN2858_c0_g1~~TRINITY_DN2858_c0_g1_i2.p1  ORF type:complete len:136 (-),score=36.82 TRINITY_DN2858_c0_g1_i2:74-481(-)